MNQKIINFKWLNYIYCGISLIIICILYYENMTGGGVDIASHYTLIDKIDRDFTISSGYVANLGEMEHYPPGSHYIASLLDKFTDSPLVSMNLINLIALACGWIIISKILLETGVLAVLFVGGIITLASFYGLVLPFFGIEVIGGNFLFGQFVATTYFLSCIYFLHKSKVSFYSQIILSILFFYLGLFFHPSFALFYFSGSFFYFLFYKFISIIEKKNSLTRVVPIIIYGFCGVLIFITHPFTKFANEMKLHNGHLGFSYFTNGATDLSTIGIYFIILTWLFSAVIFCIGLLNFKFRKFFGKNGVLLSSFLFGGSLLVILQLALLEYEVIAPYAVKKNLFGSFTLLLMIIALIFDKVIFNYILFKTYSRFNLIEEYLKLILTPALFILMATIFWSTTQTNLASVKSAQNVAHQYHLISFGDTSYRNTVAQFRDLSMPMNWLITLSQLQVDKNSILSNAVRNQDMSMLPTSSFVLSNVREDGITDNGMLEGPFRVYSSQEYVRPAIALNGHTIVLNNSNLHTTDYLNKGFSLPESWGTWSDGEKAAISFSVSKTTSKPVTVLISTNPWLTKGHESFTANAYYKDIKISEFLFDKPDIINWKFNISPDILLGETNIVIQFRFSNITSPLLVGQSADPRLLGIGIRSLQVSY